jgi:prepilin-type N-terminal cleavage/methylation domain-containing protein
MKRLKLQKGFTLIEIIIVISIMGIIADVAALTIYQATRSTSVQQTFFQVQNQSRLALEKMTKDLQMIRKNTDITMTPTDEITFIDAYGNNITYSIHNNQLMRGTKPLSDHITTLSFDYFKADGTRAFTNNEIHYITIHMTFIKSDTFNTDQEVDIQTTIFPNWF